MTAELTSRGVRRVLWITLGLNIGVCAAKILVGKLSGSMSMVADGYHSLTDGGNNIPTRVTPTATASSRPRPPWASPSPCSAWPIT